VAKKIAAKKVTKKAAKKPAKAIAKKVAKKAPAKKIAKKAPAKKAAPAKRSPNIVKPSLAKKPNFKKAPGKPFPAKLQTYMKLGKPILASIGGEVKNIIEKANCGLVSAPNNHIHLAKNIKYFAKMSNAKLNKFGMNSKLFYKNNFAQEKTLRNLDFIIKNYI
jgi:hypothetical protein